MFQVYGRLVACTLHPATRVPRFRLVAHTLRGDPHVIDVYEWHRSAETGRFRPAEDPLILEQAMTAAL